MASARPVYPQTLQSTAVLLVQAYIHERAKLTYRACSHGLLSLVIPCSDKAWGRLALAAVGRQEACCHLASQILADFCYY